MKYNILVLLILILLASYVKLRSSPIEPTQKDWIIGEQEDSRIK